MKAWLADLADTADDHMLDRLRVNVRAVDQRVQHLGAKIGRVPVLERTAAATAGGPQGFDDIGFRHWRLPERAKRRTRATARPYSHRRRAAGWRRDASPPCRGRTSPDRVPGRTQGRARTRANERRGGK